MTSILTAIKATVVALSTHADQGTVTLTPAINSLGDTYYVVTSDEQAAKYYTGDSTATGIIGTLSRSAGRWYVTACHNVADVVANTGLVYALPYATSRAHAGRMLMSWWNHVTKVERDEPGANLRALDPFELSARHRRGMFR